ncbi:HU family DNA-binding protein [Staphylococcus pseudintermedius]|uniref:HU family DNA-binding protein n=1 Tax=Staphylococcus pseudintermedius TaxID=283734 RepID=UPI0019DEEB1F|nr:HU family DNA-binding protein [Staphylococcus pseudintermedius]EGQ3727733.1 DNA-binding protein [Staphylococcus pseudintermedius]EII2717011.1 HU family DNA-binding protein [Staphylococcus pseudintermedius]MDT0973684.1 HU family DNA-binding protein [Staphylococcus pseudintermedius]
MGVRLSKNLVIKELQEQCADLGVKLSLEETRKVITAFEHTVEEAILAADSKEYDSFGFSFGQFKVIDVPQRSGHSSLFGKDWVTGAHKRVHLQFSAPLKRRLKEETLKPVE